MLHFYQIICTLWSILNTNFFSALVGGLIAALLFWLLFQKGIKKLIDYKETRRISGNFLGELLYNRIIAEDNINKADHYSKSKELTVREYETESIYEFYKRKPIELGNEFYGHLHAFYGGLKNNNIFLKIYWFSPDSTETDRFNTKKNYLNNSKNVRSAIDKILNNEKFLDHLRKMGLDKE